MSSLKKNKDIVTTREIDAYLKLSREVSSSNNKNNSVILIDKALQLVQNKRYDTLFWAMNITKISTEFEKQGKRDESKMLINLALDRINNTKDHHEKSEIQFFLASELAKQKKFNHAQIISSQITDEFYKDYSLQEICIELSKDGKTTEAYSLAKKIKEREHTLLIISEDLANDNKILEASKILLDLLVKTVYSKTFFEKNLESILEKLISNKKDSQALFLLNTISSKSTERIIKTSSILFKKGMSESAYSLLLEAKNDSFFKENLASKCEILAKIATEMRIQGKVNESLTLMKKAKDSSGKIKDIYIRNLELVGISQEFIKQKRKKEALSIIMEILKNIHLIKDIDDKDSIFGLISQDLAELGESLKSIESSLRIIDTSLRSKVLAYISGEFLRQGFEELSVSIMQKAIDFTKEITDIKDKTKSLTEIYRVLANEGREQESILISNYIIELNRNSIEEKIWDYKIDTTIAAARFNKWEFAQDISSLIKGKSNMYKCWTRVGSKINEVEGWRKSLFAIKNLKTEVIIKYYLKGWAEAINTSETNQELLQEALPYLIHDTEALEVVLQKYAVHETFLGNSSHEQLQRLNQTLNIQWALDIVDSFSEESETDYLSIN